jgi:hypothetical protein
MENTMRKLILAAACTLLMQPAHSFCGFYVAKADAQLFNNTSQVIFARNGDRSVVTMSSDFTGDVRDFAMVVPVPQVIRKEDVRVVERALFDKLDAYSGPRLVEYWDPQPCVVEMVADEAVRTKDIPMAATAKASPTREEKEFSVRVEAKYTVGEYDILVLSAEESNGLEKWLIKNGYRIPDGAREVLEPYIRGGMKFFVVKVNLEELSRNGSQILRPLQVSFTSEKFMLPIRLGMANAHGTQDLIVYLLTQNGRVETQNYRTAKIPTDRNVPEFIKDEFGGFYVDVYKTTRRKEGRNNVFLEYAWNISGTAGVKCDPCAGAPPIFADLIASGVNWLSSNGWNGYAGNVFFTRLHVSYDRENFPQDLVFAETPNRENFQGRYIITHAAPGPFNCPQAKEYLGRVQQRRYRELQELASLTGRSIQRYDSYLQKLQGYVPVTPPVDPAPLPDPVKPAPDPVKPKPAPVHPVPPAPPVHQAMADPMPAMPDDATGGIDQASFIAGEEGARTVSEAGAGEKGYLYLAVSILVSTVLVLLSNRRKA